MAKHTDALGIEPISSLLLKQAIPASIGILVMSLNILVDSIFVGNWIGSLAIAAINVVLPVSFFIAAIGLAIGIGGSSILSRALGANNHQKAVKVFGNQISLTLLATITLVTAGLFFTDYLVAAFGGKGKIFNLAKDYYVIVMYGIPILALNMMANSVVRAEGKAKFAMIAMIVPSIVNLFLDYLFINILDLGMKGAGWATTISYLSCFSFLLYFFLVQSSLKLKTSSFRLDTDIVKEISALGATSLVRQGIVSVVILIMNNIVMNLSGEWALATYAIISRLLMFILFPIIGVTQGFLPIASYNYGAEKYVRVTETIKTAILYSGVLGIFIFIIIMVFPEFITQLFIGTNADKLSVEQQQMNLQVLKETPMAIRIVFAVIPIVPIQLIGSAYFQAVGKAKPAFFLTLTRQGFFLIPSLFILPNFFGIIGVWLSFTVSDFCSTLITAYFLKREIRMNLNPKITI